MAEYQPAHLESSRKPSQEAPVAERGTRAAVHPLMNLQARAGNQAVARFVQRAGEEDELQMKHDPALQREDEEKEDESVQMTHDLSLQREDEEKEDESVQMRHDLSLQREGEEKEDESVQMRHDLSLQRAGEEDEMQMKHDPTPQVGLEGGPVGAGIEGRINSMRGGGSAAPEGIRGEMEAATGADLSGVRVHQDKESDALNRQLTAKAFTTGNDIFLRSDSNTSDSHLMAHELAHVVQQSSGRSASGGGGMSAGAANDPLEHEADKLADSVLSGQAQREAEEARA